MALYLWQCLLVLDNNEMNKFILKEVKYTKLYEHKYRRIIAVFILTVKGTKKIETVYIVVEIV